MPVTKTAKRALRGSLKKAKMNSVVLAQLEKAIREANKSKAVEKIRTAISLADKASKKKTIHKNKAARIKQTLTKLLSSKSVGAKKIQVKKSTKTSKK
jgi:ribosomal protein S20